MKKEFQPCRNCTVPIRLKDGRWIHKDGFRSCRGRGDEAEPISAEGERKSALEAEERYEAYRQYNWDWNLPEWKDATQSEKNKWLYAPREKGLDVEKVARDICAAFVGTCTA
jgi:hypothetical protein